MGSQCLVHDVCCDVIALRQRPQKGQHLRSHYALLCVCGHVFVCVCGHVFVFVCLCDGGECPMLVCVGMAI